MKERSFLNVFNIRSTVNLGVWRQLRNDDDFIQMEQGMELIVSIRHHLSPILYSQQLGVSIPSDLAIVQSYVYERFYLISLGHSN